MFINVYKHEVIETIDNIRIFIVKLRDTIHNRVTF